MNVFDKIIDFKFKNDTGLINLSGGFFVSLIKKMYKENDDSILIVTPNMFEARSLYNKFYDDSVVLFEDDEVSFSDGSSVSPELKVERINTLNELVSGKKKIVLTDVRGFTRRLISVNDFDKRNLSFKIGSSFSFEKIADELVEFGYERVSIVEKMGDFALRGFVLDIFPINSDDPIRIEFFGDDVESIKYFDLDSQKSTTKLNDVVILPFNEVANGNATLYDYLSNPILIFKDYDQTTFAFEKMASDSVELDYDFDSFYFNFKSISVKKKMYYFDFDSNVSGIKLTNTIDFKVKSVPKFGENFDQILIIKVPELCILCLYTVISNLSYRMIFVLNIFIFFEGLEYSNTVKSIVKITYMLHWMLLLFPTSIPGD